VSEYAQVVGRIEALERENRRLRAEVAALHGATAHPAPDSLSRRDVLRKAAMVGAGAVTGVAVLSGRQAQATTGAMQFGAVNDAGDATTTLKIDGSGAALALENHSAQHNGDPGVAAYLCEGGGYALYCYSVNEAASSTIQADAWGQAAAIHAQQFNNVTNAPAINASSQTGGPAPGLHASSSGGSAVVASGKVGVEAIGTPAVEAHNDGTSGPVLVVDAGNVNNADAVVQITGEGSGTGISVSSASGRGGEFSGLQAQLRLMPGSGAQTHPATGKRGDLFVDGKGRLWYCRGKTNWKQLA